MTCTHCREDIVPGQFYFTVKKMYGYLVGPDNPTIENCTESNYHSGCYICNIQATVSHSYNCRLKENVCN